MIIEEILGSYRGHARIRRLIHFAQHSTKSEAQTAVNEAAKICLESDAFLMYMNLIQKTKDVASIEQNKEYIEAKKKQMMSQVEKKHRDIQKQQVTKDKQLIRIEIAELGDIYYKYGDFASSIQQYTRAINLTPPGKELVSLALKAGQSAIQQETYHTAAKYLSDLVTVINVKDEYLNNMMSALQACIHIVFGQYRQACNSLLSITTPELPELELVVSKRHLGSYLLVCALVSQPRHVLYDMLKNSQFAKLQNLAPRSIQDIIQYYLDSNYEKLFTTLHEVEKFLGIDYLFGKHIFQQLEEIKDKAYLQYVRPYSRVSLGQVAEELQVPVHELKQKFIYFIRKGKLDAKIDLEQNALEKKSAFDDGRTNTAKAVELLKTLAFEMENSCFQQELRVMVSTTLDLIKSQKK